MVFESIVAELLNRFLGDFVENLNASQLNIGILGGLNCRETSEKRKISKIKFLETIFFLES